MLSSSDQQSSTETMARLRIKNWKTFQHYDHRCPPWIKLHFKILSSRDWVKASDSERVLAIACMLIASQDEAKDGSFDADPDYIQRVAYLNTPPDFKPLIDKGFLEVLADASACKQESTNGVTEKRQSREETETEQKPILIRNRPDTASDVASFVMQGMGLSGTKVRWTIEDAVKRSMESFDLPAMGAAAQIVTSWQEYEAADIEFRAGPKTFLEDGLFLTKSRWRLKSGDTKTGRFTELLNSMETNDGEPGEFSGSTGSSPSTPIRV
jgi:hypothetical protein